MARDWLQMREDLHEDPAVLFMAERLQVRPETIVGYCHRFWGLVSRQTVDGTIRGPTLASLGSIINLAGFPELLVEADWLEYDDSGPVPVTKIPKFERWLSKGAKQRAMEKERKRATRAAAEAAESAAEDPFSRPAEGGDAPDVSGFCPDSVRDLSGKKRTDSGLDGDETRRDETRDERRGPLKRSRRLSSTTVSGVDAPPVSDSSSVPPADAARYGPIRVADFSDDERVHGSALVKSILKAWRDAKGNPRRFVAQDLALAQRVAALVVRGQLTQVMLQDVLERLPNRQVKNRVGYTRGALRHAAEEKLSLDLDRMLEAVVLKNGSDGEPEINQKAPGVSGDER